MVNKMARNYANKDFDAQFDAFMKESLSSEDSINSKHLSKLLQPPKPRDDKLWWLDENEDDPLDDETFGQGLNASAKSFLKKKNEPKHSTPVYESEDSKVDGRTQSKIDPIKKKAAEKQKAKGKAAGSKMRGSKASSMSKDSLDDISEKSEETDGHRTHTGNRNHSPRMAIEMEKRGSFKPGAETLEEIRDKENFFKKYENDDPSVDYGRLNRELSQTASGFGFTPDKKPQQHNDIDDSQAATPVKNDLKKPSLLSNVALMDSMESTLNTSTSPGKKGDNPGDGAPLGHTLQDTLKTLGTGLMGTNTSQEILALQEAYRDVHNSPTIKPDDTGPRGAGHDDTGQDVDRNDSRHTPGIDEPDSVIPRPQVESRSPPKADRTMEDIMREMRELQAREEAIQQADIQMDIHTDRRPARRGLKEKSPRSKQQPKPSVSFQSREGKGSRSPERVSPSRKGAKSTGGRLSDVKSSGYGQRARSNVEKERESFRRSEDRKLSPSRPMRDNSVSPKKTPPRKTTWSPAHVATQKIKGTESPQVALQRSTSAGDLQQSQLMASVQSFVQYIQDQFTGTERDSDPLLKAAKALSANLQGNRGAALEREKTLLAEQKLREHQWKAEQQEHTKTKADLENRERELARRLEAVKLEYEEQIFKLKQENFVLSAKVSELESEAKTKLVNGSAETASKDQLSRLEKEIQEQEQLMAGYQTENKRLYDELKAAQKQNKNTEERLFRENQKLHRDLASLRSQLERKETELQSKGVITSLAVQQEIAAGNNIAPPDDTSRVTALEAELAKMRESERESREEVERLTKKLRWYAENQEILDRDVLSLKGKDEEIARLRQRIETLQSESGKRVEESKIRTRERAADAKRIQDLERQVKEMEAILRRRHPNSLPTLMLAACAADTAAQPAHKAPSVTALEARIAKLEGELGSKDEESGKLLRAMEQKFTVIKLQYEERIAELEKLGGAGLGGESHPHTHTQALERELEAVRERYRKQITELTADITRLTDDLRHRAHQDETIRADLKISQDREKELTNRIRALQQELELREKTGIKDNPGKKRNMSENTQLKKVERGVPTDGKGKGGADTRSRPLSPYRQPPDVDRLYQPQTFTGAHVSDLQEDNDRLRSQVEELQLSLDQQRVELRKSLAETEGVMRRSREEYEDQISSLRSSHQHELQRVLTDQAMLHSGSRLAQLQSKVDTQEVMLAHLRSQLAQAQVNSEQVSVLKIREAALETQVKQLQEEVREARTHHTPEMRQFEAVQEKIAGMERRHESRELELQQLLTHSQQAASLQLSQERDQWQKLIDAKNQEVRRFQTELDSILEVLRELKRQGVVLSTPAFRS